MQASQTSENQAAQSNGFGARVASLVPDMISPNQISLFRLACAVAMSVVGLSGNYLGWVIILGLAAGMSDLLDGAVARHRGQVTKLGAFLDPLGDKILALSATLVLLYHGVLTGWALAAILVVEAHAVVIPLLHMMRQSKLHQPLWPAPRVKPSRLGKYKTFGLAWGLGFQIIAAWAGWPWLMISAKTLMWISILAGVWASAKYYRDWFTGCFDETSA
ncbi:MAG: CDP-alcohol phosphatidyltransferase family protein [Desulfarculaceae bacterium]|nr:CDP-alcohol phosphatidyltransferase family protein [Desulfarculaceae bacterium]MCF8047359.1 CDP-alcohol phosphatidyltransferase family protein [Desulfarculaceae bacterium]MCF8099774.1 CDP-alcohol phosphatidyltransferase family protein [Desulfarculaceae bacterium]MCF8122436.1 CDP-alcohol phosphatidyltransferase family protein [Desulfarculaceae bacterium]